MLEDKLLLWKLKHGHKDALRLIYEKYKDTLRTIAAAILHDTHAAEDVLHDVFVKFAEKARTLQIHTSLKNYLITCVVNRSRDHFRRQQELTISLDKTPSIPHFNCPESQMIANEKSQLLTETLARIPYEQREVILLHLNGALSFRQVAKIQQTSLSTVHGRYRYGLKKLQALLNGELEK